MLFTCSIILHCYAVQIFPCYGVQMFIWRGKGIFVQKYCLLICLSEIYYYNSYDVQQQIDMFEQCVLANLFFFSVLWQNHNWVMSSSQFSLWRSGEGNGDWRLESRGGGQGGRRTESDLQFKTGSSIRLEDIIEPKFNSWRIKLAKTKV